MRAMDTVHGPPSNFLNSLFIWMFFLNKPNSLTFHFPTKIFQKKKSPPTACLKFHKSGLNECNLLLRMDLNLKIQREITSQEPRKLCFFPPWNSSTARRSLLTFDIERFWKELALQHCALTCATLSHRGGGRWPPLPESCLLTASSPRSGRYRPSF